MTIAEIMLTVMALALVSSAITAILLFTRIKRALRAAEEALNRVSDLSHRVSELTPRVARVLDNASEELVALKGVTQRTEAITAKVQGITANVHGISEELRQGAEFLNLARRSRAIWAGARAGISTLRRVSHHTDGNGEGDHHE